MITIWEVIQKRNHEIKSDNFCCSRKVERAITNWGAIEKSPILQSQYWKNYHFKRVPKIISHFDGSNNIFADCRKEKRRDNNIVVQKVSKFHLSFNELMKY